MILLNKIDNLIFNSYWSINSSFSTLLMIIKLKIVGVKHKPKIRFYGLSVFKKASKSRIEIGSNCTFRSNHTSNLIGINRPCIITVLTPQGVLIIGNNCGFSGTVIGCFLQIILGNNVRCGANTLITDSDWHEDDYRAGRAKAIVIKDNVWLGEGVKVLKGVCIGENSVIGAGSVVTKDIPANVVAAGNPCKVIKTLPIK